MGLDLLAGLARVGRNTVMRALKCAWTCAPRNGSVVALAPSAAAAAVRADELCFGSVFESSCLCGVGRPVVGQLVAPALPGGQWSSRRDPGKRAEGLGRLS